MILDGYIRLTYKAFLELRFDKHEAWEDEDLRMELVQEGTSAMRAGYCEWTASRDYAPAHEPKLASVGWTWIEGIGGDTTPIVDGLSSNIMLLSEQSYDLGVEETQRRLHRWLAERPWQAELPVFPAATFPRWPLPQRLSDRG